MSKLVLNYPNGLVRVNVTKNNISIEESYKVQKKSDMRNILEQLKSLYEDEHNNVLDNRTIRSIICEWRSHNLVYSLGLFRDRTRTVDINYPIPDYMNIVYFMASLFYWS